MIGSFFRMNYNHLDILLSFLDTKAPIYLSHLNYFFYKFLIKIAEYLHFLSITCHPSPLGCMQILSVLILTFSTLNDSYP